MEQISKEKMWWDRLKTVIIQIKKKINKIYYICKNTNAKKFLAAAVAQQVQRGQWLDPWSRCLTPNCSRWLFHHRSVDNSVNASPFTTSNIQVIYSYTCQHLVAILLCPPAINATVLQ